MAQQNINTGSSPDSGTGDPLRTCFIKAEENFTELYDAVSSPFPFTGDASITGTLSVTGPITASHVTASSIYASTLYSLNNTHNKIELNSDNIKFIVGNNTFQQMSNSGVIFNPNNSSDIDFAIKGGAGSAEILTAIASTGNVGIGTNSPQEKLHVVGTIQATGYYGNITEGDPSVAGQFFQTSSEAFGGTTPYYQIVCISQG